MSYVDLTEHLTPDLVLRLGERDYTVPPPSRDAGIRLASIVAMGTAVFVAADRVCPACGRTGEVEVPEETRQLVASMKHTDLERLSLGDAAVDAMIADGVPEAHRDQAAQYAMYYWVLGKATADDVISAGQSTEQQAKAPKA